MDTELEQMNGEPQEVAHAETVPPGRRRVKRRQLAAAALAVVAVVVIGGIGYAAGGAGGSTNTSHDGFASRAAQYGNGAESAAGQPATAQKLAPAAGGATTADAGSAAVGGDVDPVIAQTEGRLVVKTGQVGLIVSDVDRAVIQAQAAIVGMGGEVGQTQVTGSGDNKFASITYRVPVARWDDALAALRKLATRVASEQSGSTDVTSQAIDLDARISNLKSTEQALQSIMAKATQIEDVLAVQNQLTTVQGQIEQLTAQSNHLKDQAAMSTLVATFQLPSSVVTAATHDWTFGAQVNEAIAALVHVGQGLATVAVWLVIVALPLGLGILILVAVTWLVLRRIVPRRQAPAATSAEG